MSETRGWHARRLRHRWSHPLRVESLEDRLALSHVPLGPPVPYDWSPQAMEARAPASREFTRGDYGWQHSVAVPMHASRDGNDRSVPAMQIGLNFGGPLNGAMSYASYSIVVIVFQPQVFVGQPDGSAPPSALRTENPPPHPSLGRPSIDLQSALASAAAPPAATGGSANAGTAAAIAASQSQRADAGVLASHVMMTLNSAAAAPPQIVMAAPHAPNLAPSDNPAAASSVDTQLIPQAESTPHNKEAAPAIASAAASTAPSAWSKWWPAWDTETASPASIDVTRALQALQRTALVPGLALDVEAVDRAFAVLLGEVEKLGGEWVGYFDELGISPWTAAATTAALAGMGGRFYFKRRGNRRRNDAEDDASVRWLFARLQSPGEA